VKSSKNTVFYKQCISCYKLAYFSDEKKKREGGEEDDGQRTQESCIENKAFSLVAFQPIGSW
jgi:hypothetical protein